jgi:hypothetical protein
MAVFPLNHADRGRFTKDYFTSDFYQEVTINSAIAGLIHAKRGGAGVYTDHCLEPKTLLNRELPPSRRSGVSSGPEGPAPRDEFLLELLESRLGLGGVELTSRIHLPFLPMVTPNFF